jgi:uncharacterized damage-inducible protein DinB
MTGSSDAAARQAQRQPVPAGREPEPWLRGTLTAIPPVQRAVIHALELAGEDLRLWGGSLTAEEFYRRPYGLPPVSFHLRHISGSLDRFFTYAQGAALSAVQLAALAGEMDGPGEQEAALDEFQASLRRAAEYLRESAGRDLSEPVKIGRKELPSTLGGLLVHAADHTQRHAGQAVTTAKLLLAMRSAPGIGTTKY